MSHTVVIKNNGDHEVFDEQKLVRSLKKSLATERQIEKVLGVVHSSLHDGITTGEIYNLAQRALQRYQLGSPSTLRYSLKRAVMDLGPSGFPFEVFVGRIFTEMGYMCRTGVMVQGNCLEHEIDILAYKGDEVICMEAKFHNEPYLKSDTKIALYVKARFDDLLGQTIMLDGEKRVINRGILVTNTNFTDNVHTYVSCINTFDLISWSKPEKNSLIHFIETYDLYPLTVIPDLSKREVSELLAHGVVMCKDLKEHKEVMNKIGIRKRKQALILEAVTAICKC